ncbi:hypothetical protein J6590_001802 [Homalodisca vitripennis]|nr:hypothetical protein J6590_001802 [Homalodisca vitripennis]
MDLPIDCRHISGKVSLTKHSCRRHLLLQRPANTRGTTTSASQISEGASWGSPRPVPTHLLSQECWCYVKRWNLVGQVGTCSIEAAGHDAIGDGPGGAVRAAESRCVLTKYNMVKQVGQVGICSIEVAGHNAMGDGPLGGPGRRIKMCYH